MNQSPANPHKDFSLTTLIEAVLNGQADDAQFAELEQRLQTDSAARDTYATYMDLHCELTARFAVEGDIVGLEAELEKEFREGELANFRRTAASESMQRQPRHSLLKRGFALATFAVLVLVGFFVWYERLSQNTSAQDTLAQIRDLEGEITIIGSAGTSAARVGDVLRLGERLLTAEQNARAVLEYADGTTVEVHYGSAVQVPADSDVRLRLLSGSIEVTAAPQPANRPLILATDHARYVVLGTRFRLYRNEDSTRLELNEGSVRLERQENDRVVESVEVESGHVAIASADAKPVEVVPLAPGLARLRASFPVPGTDVAVAPASEWLAINDQSRGLRMLRLADGELTAEYRRDAGPSSGMAIAADGQTVLKLNPYGSILIWPLGEPEAVKLAFTGENVRSSALSPDGRYAAQSSETGIAVVRINYSGKRLEPVAELTNRDGRMGKAWSLAFSGDGQRLAAGFWDGTLRVSDVASARTVYETRLEGTIIPLAISDDGRLLAAHTNTGGLSIVDSSTGEQRVLSSSAGTGILSLRFSPDGRWLAAGCSDRTARVWSTVDGRPLLVIEAEHIPRSVAWIPDRRLLITVESSVKVWEYEM